MSTKAKRRENAELKRIAGCSFSGKCKCRTGLGRDANDGLHRARPEARIQGAPAIAPERGAIRSGDTARDHRAVMISAAPAASGKPGFVIRAEQRAQQGQAKQQQKQDC